MLGAPGRSDMTLRSILANTEVDRITEKSDEGRDWVEIRILETGQTGWIHADSLKTKNGLSVYLKKTPQAGDVFTFGRYEQDEKSGADPIEWQVLTVEKGRVLVISLYGLDAKAYNTDFRDITWEECSLRKWLNGEFYESSFNSQEKVLIEEMTNSNPYNIEYGINGGNDTRDKVFLLNINETKKYCEGRDVCICKPTYYAIQNGAYEEMNRETIKGNSIWWLRSPGSRSGDAAFVGLSGGIFSLGDRVSHLTYVVRPALWLYL